MIDLEPKHSLIFTSGWFTYIGVLCISLLGGLTSYTSRKDETFSMKNLLAQLLSAAFAGFLTALGCEYASISGPLTGILCGIAAHMGTPALIALAMKMPMVKNFFENTK